MVGWIRLRTGGALLLGALLVAACAGSAATVQPVNGQASGSVVVPSASPSPSPAPAASPSPSLAGGGVPSPEDSAPAFNACNLLTNAQATAVNGGGYGDGVDHIVGPSQVCVRQSASAHSSLTIEVTVEPTSAAAQARFAALKGSLAKYNPVDVSGVGGQAFIARSQSATSVTGGIYVLDGVTSFNIVYLQGSVPVDATLKIAALLALGALP
jgi:hypothetical protein